MKRFIALSLAAIMAVSACACGSEKTKLAGKEIFSCYDLKVQNFAESFDASEIVMMILLFLLCKQRKHLHLRSIGIIW